MLKEAHGVIIEIWSAWTQKSARWKGQWWWQGVHKVYWSFCLFVEVISNVFCNFLRCVLFRTGINRSLCFQCVFKSLKWFSCLLIADLCLFCGLFVNLASSRAPRRNLCLPIQTPQRSCAAADVNSPPALPCALLLLSLPPPMPSSHLLSPFCDRQREYYEGRDADGGPAISANTAPHVQLGRFGSWELSMSWPQYETMVWMKVVICGDSFEEATIM